MEKIEIEFFEKQFEALQFKTQFGLVCAGSQGGKSFCGACWSAKKIEEKKGVGAIIAPSYKILQQSTLQKFFGLFPQFRKYHKEQKGVIELSSTNKIFVRSADNPLGLEGLTLDWAWLDEAGMMSRLVWNVIRARVSITQGQVFITTTPYSMNWIYDDFYIPWKNKTDKALSFFSWKSTDNKRFSKEYFEAERKRMRPEEFARRYCGEFKKMHGLVYNLNEKQIIDIQAKENINYICGIDWGYKNPSAIIILGIAPNAVYVVDEWKETEKTTAEIIEVLKHYISLYHIINIYPDPAEPDRIKELLNAGIQSNSVSKDIKGGISYMQQLINENKFFVFKKNKYFLDEINSYHYPENNNIDVPVKSNDHLCFVAGTLIFANKGFIPIEKLKESHKVLTRKGYKNISKLHNREAEVFEVSLNNGIKLISTGDHPFWVQGEGFIQAKDLKKNAILFNILHNLWYQRQLYSKALNSGDIQTLKGEQKEFITGQTQTISKKELDFCIGKYGKKLTGKFQKVFAFITKTIIRSTITFPIFNLWTPNCTFQSIQKNMQKEILIKSESTLIRLDPLLKNGIHQSKAENGISNTAKKSQRILNQKNISVYSAIKYFLRNLLVIINSVQTNANLHSEESQASIMKKENVNTAGINLLQTNIQKRDSVLVVAVRKLNKKRKVYNLSVKECPEYYANGVLVSNCDATRYALFSYQLNKRTNLTDCVIAG